MTTFFNLNLFAEVHSWVWYWQQCDGATRFVVFIISGLIAWAVYLIINKFIALKCYRRENIAHEMRLRNKKLLEMSLSAERKRRNVSPYETLTNAACIACGKYLRNIKTEGDIDICVRHIENAIQRDMSHIMENYEKHLIALSSFVAGGPFLGLLGTVWGIIITFGSLTEKATIAQLAPGVAGALIATLTGLILAIPTVFCYNGILSRTKQMTVEIEAFASLLTDSFELELNEALRNGTLPQADTVPAEKTSPRVPEASGAIRNPYTE